MIIYRNPARDVNTADALFELIQLAKDQQARPTQEGVREILIGLGELEAGVADALCPDFDHNHPPLLAFRRAGLIAGQLLSMIIGRAASAARIQAFQLTEAIAEAGDHRFPPSVRISFPEGYSFYALYPEMYLRSAQRFRSERQPLNAVCIGLRSIGTSLCSAVGGQLQDLGCTVFSLSVRPRGHPFDRKLTLSPQLEEELKQRAGWPVLIIDEGPGLSGSSICSAAEKVSELGFEDRNIFIFPAWEGNPAAFLSREAQNLWPRFTKYITQFEEIRDGLSPFSENADSGAVRDISAGGWRSLLYRDKKLYPAVQPSFERRKYLISPKISPRQNETENTPVFAKFCGLGSHGKLVFQRAQLLSEEGIHPPIRGFREGFLLMDFHPGSPLVPEKQGEHFLKFASRYFSFVARTFPATYRAQMDELIKMIQVNILEGLGHNWVQQVEFVSDAGYKMQNIEPIFLDNRVAAHEWMSCGEGFYKMDSAEHFEDHFFPGPQDILWDLAAFRIEFGLGERLWREFIADFQKISGRAGIEENLPFYSIAYLAFRLGYCAHSTSVLGDSEDGPRFESLRSRYASLLKIELQRFRK